MTRAGGSRTQLAHSPARFFFLAAVAASALVSSPGCGGGGKEGGERGALAELESFAFVPAGRSALFWNTPRGTLEIALSQPLLVGMYEVTRGEYRAFVERAGDDSLDPLLRERLQAWSPAEDDLPVSFVTHDEAAAYAAWSGLRLLTAAEWLYCAVSPRNLSYPWGDAWQQGRANTFELGLARYSSTAVGTFEGGRTPSQIYDMLGNVWEWVREAPEEPDGRGNAVALGGSYLSYRREIVKDGVALAQSLSRRSRADDVGLRVAADAREWLERNAERLSRARDSRERLNAIGRRFGGAAVPLLLQLQQSVDSNGARRSLEALLEGARG